MSELKGKSTSVNDKKSIYFEISEILKNTIHILAKSIIYICIQRILYQNVDLKTNL